MEYHDIYGIQVKSCDMPAALRGIQKSTDGKCIEFIRCSVGGKQYINTVEKDHIMYCIDNSSGVNKLFENTYNLNKPFLVYVFKANKNYKYGLVYATLETDYNENRQKRYKLIRKPDDEPGESNDSHIIKRQRISRESIYNKVVFRSKLEARWAKYMDMLGVEWRYERQTIRIENDEEYTPDFFLPYYRAFLEIKPDDPPMDARKKCEETCKHTGLDVYLFYKDNFIAADAESGRDYSHSSGIRAMRWYRESNVVKFDGEKHVWMADDERGVYMGKLENYDTRFNHPRIKSIHDTFNDDGITDA